MFFNSIKEIFRLVSKGMSNIYIKVAIEKKFSKLRFCKSKKFVSTSVFGELQLTQISMNFKTSCCNIKIRGLGAKVCVSFLFFNFERNCDVLKSKIPCFLLNKKINFNKNETESKMENPTDTRKENLVLQLIRIMN